MQKKNWKQRMFLAVLMGILTLFFCLYLADHILHVYPGYYAVYWWKYNVPGKIVFFISLTGLPVLFRRWIYLRDTLINLPLYFLLYFPIYDFCGSNAQHFFLGYSGGFIDVGPVFTALITVPILWGTQSLVFLAFNVCNFVIAEWRAGRRKP